MDAVYALWPRESYSGSKSWRSFLICWGIETVSATYSCLIARVFSSLPYIGGPQKTYGYTQLQFSGWGFGISKISCTGYRLHSATILVLRSCPQIDLSRCERSTRSHYRLHKYCQPATGGPCIAFPSTVVNLRNFCRQERSSVTLRVIHRSIYHSVRDEYISVY